MTNPSDFVMYVVMVRPPKAEKFNPAWSEWTEPVYGRFAYGWAKKRDADKLCKTFRACWGKKNAYVQRYGPYSSGCGLVIPSETQ